MSLTNFIINFS